MREILFRGKRIDNGEWVEGDLCHMRLVRRNYNGNAFIRQSITKCKSDLSDWECLILPEPYPNTQD